MISAPLFDPFAAAEGEVVGGAESFFAPSVAFAFPSNYRRRRRKRGWERGWMEERREGEEKRSEAEIPLPFDTFRLRVVPLSFRRVPQSEFWTPHSAWRHHTTRPRWRHRYSSNDACVLFRTAMISPSFMSRTSSHWERYCNWCVTITTCHKCHWKLLPSLFLLCTYRFLAQYSSYTSVKQMFRNLNDSEVRWWLMMTSSLRVGRLRRAGRREDIRRQSCTQHERVRRDSSDHRSGWYHARLLWVIMTSSVKRMPKEMTSSQTDRKRQKERREETSTGKWWRHRSMDLASNYLFRSYPPRVELPNRVRVRKIRWRGDTARNPTAIQTEHYSEEIFFFFFKSETVKILKSDNCNGQYRLRIHGCWATNATRPRNSALPKKEKRCWMTSSCLLLMMSSLNLSAVWSDQASPKAKSSFH